MENLIERTKDEARIPVINEWIKKNGVPPPVDAKFKVGDVIHFWSGYHDDIHYLSKVLGFDERGWLYILWSCYWSSIDPESEITKVKLFTK